MSTPKSRNRPHIPCKSNEVIIQIIQEMKDAETFLKEFSKLTKAKKELNEAAKKYHLFGDIKNYDHKKFTKARIKYQNVYKKYKDKVG